MARGGYSEAYESSQLLHSCHEKVPEYDISYKFNLLLRLRVLSSPILIFFLLLFRVVMTIPIKAKIPRKRKKRRRNAEELKRFVRNVYMSNMLHLPQLLSLLRDFSWIYLKVAFRCQIDAVCLN